MIDQEERRESCQQRGQVTNECMQFQFTINQLPVTFHGLYSEQPRSLHKVFLFPIHTFASVLQNILLIKTFLDQRPGNEGGKLGSNTDRRYAEAEATHGLESSDVTKTSASRVPKLNATRHDATRRDATQGLTHDLFKERSHPREKCVLHRLKNLAQTRDEILQEKIHNLTTAD